MELAFREEIELKEHELQRDTRIMQTKLLKLGKQDREVGKVANPIEDSEESVELSIYGIN